LEPPAPAWPASQSKIRFDAGYEPVVAGKRLFIASMVCDRLSAYDTETGNELWRFYADGPIRLAPLAWKDNVYVVSDDGHLHCLDAASGQRRWSVRGGPDCRRLLGNQRLTSAWPARGGPVLWEEDDGRKATIYFAAGVWPFMGTFLHAVDAESGKTVWTNSGSGSTYLAQQHYSPAFAGVAPQGYLAATPDLLLVSGGRTVPAAYDRKTGKLLYYNPSSRALGKDAGGYEVTVAGEYFFNQGCLYTLADGKPILKTPAQILGERVLAATKKGVDLYELQPFGRDETVKDKYGKTHKVPRYRFPRTHQIELATPVKRFYCLAGARAYAGGEKGLIAAIDLPPLDRPGLSWSARVEGEAWSMVPADGKLLVTTTTGKVYCFGEEPAGRVLTHSLPAGAVDRDQPMPGDGGYAMVWGLGERAFDRLMELAADYHVIGIDPDAALVASLRHRLDRAGVYGRRVHLLAGDPLAMRLPPYLASRIELGDLQAAGLGRGAQFAQGLFHCLRPYGGKASAAAEAGDLAALSRAVASADLPGAGVESAAGALEVVRDGPLAGSAPWTHENADVANTVVSRDRLVKPPLGLLWFGGPSHDDILPRHGHGPSPQIIGGRAFIQGPHVLRCVDVYTGRLLWQREFKDVGKFYNSTRHQPGANEIGSNFVSLADGVYIVFGRDCLRLDPSTGKTLREFKLPCGAGEEAPHWGYLGVYENVLLAGSTPVAIRGDGRKTPLNLFDNAPYASSSRCLVAMDRHDGRVLWTRRADQAFRHNAIAAGAGRVFCIDGFSPVALGLLKRIKKAPEEPVTLRALNVRTGRVVWETSEKVSGTWLGYSAEHDVLLEGGSPGKDRAKDETTSHLAAYRGSDGGRLWQEQIKYVGRPMLHGKTIYTDGLALDLLTGKPRTRLCPITGKTVPWTFTRNYGCNTPIAGQHLLLFRSAAAGFYDLLHDSGTGNWGGFKSSCTSNLIPADGVLTALDYTRTCTCSYQNQCSLALTTMPDVEEWTFQSWTKLAGPVRRVGVNFGAPGDWRSQEGTLWLDWPSVGGKSPALGVQVEGKPAYLRRHALDIAGPARQVAACGIENARSVRIALYPTAKDEKKDKYTEKEEDKYRVRDEDDDDEDDDDAFADKGKAIDKAADKNADKSQDPNPAEAQPQERSYTVRLYFAELSDLEPGRRVFDVAVQGQTVLRGFDPAREAGGPGKTVMREISNVRAVADLKVELTPLRGQTLLCGIEVIAE